MRRLGFVQLVYRGWVLSSGDKFFNGTVVFTKPRQFPGPQKFHLRSGFFIHVTAGLLELILAQQVVFTLFSDYCYLVYL